MSTLQEIMNNPKKFQKKITWVIVIIAVLILIGTGFYSIYPQEVGVIQRLGKYSHTTLPGLHFKIPFGIDNLTKVKVKRVYKSEFGFRTLQPGVQTRYSSRDYSNESLMLTGDLNIAAVEWIVQYRIMDPVRFLFNVRNVGKTIRDLSETSVREIVGNHSIDETIVLNRKEIAIKAEKLLQERLKKYKTGIEIVTVKLQNVNPPDPVKKSFNEVNSAKQEEEKIVNNAWEDYNNVIPKAKGKAKQMIREAEGYAVKRKNRATGEAEKFLKVLAEYKKAKRVTKKRLYLETMVEIMPKVYIVDEDQKSLLPLLNLDKGGQ